VVTGGVVTVPEGVEVGGPIHVLGGHVLISGEVDSDVLLLSGTVTLTETSTVAGTMQHYGGDLTMAPGSSVGSLTGIDVASARSQPGKSLLATALLGALLAFLGAWGTRRSPKVLTNVSDAVRGHPLITVTVGTLLALTAITVLVFMAFTVVLIPVALLGLAAGVAVAGYATVALGHLAGRYLPIRRPDVATAAGVLLVVAGLRAVQTVPVAGDAIALALVLTGLGSVFLTYLGLRRFTPAVLPE